MANPKEKAKEKFQNSFAVNKIDLKKMITSLNISETSTDSFLAKLDKLHRHIDAVGFVGMLEKMGLKQKDISNIMRRMGMNDTKIIEIFNMLDEAKIEATFGKITELRLEK